MTIATTLIIEKCANCGHDIMARDDLAKHTNVDQEGHRFFTKFCQECYRSGGSCASPSVGKQVIEVGREPEVKPPETEGEIPARDTRQCPECNFSGRLQRVALHMRINHPFPLDRMKELLAAGRTVQEIALELNRGVNTIRYHMKRHDAGSGDGAGTQGEDPGSIPPEDHRRQAPTESQKAFLHENEVLRQKILDLERQVSAAEETPRTIPADHAQEGRLQSRIEISCFTGYYDTQKKLISETIKEEIYHAAKGKTITMETRVLPGDARRIVVEISGMEEKEVQA